MRLFSNSPRTSRHLMSSAVSFDFHVLGSCSSEVLASYQTRFAKERSRNGSVYQFFSSSSSGLYRQRARLPLHNRLPAVEILALRCGRTRGGAASLVPQQRHYLSNNRSLDVWTDDREKRKAIFMNL